ncbi:MAG: penicillin-binding protein activator, partial [Patescibacteria group bacterium]
PVITPSYAPIQNRQNPRNPLMVWMDPTIEAKRMAEYVFSQGVRSVAVLGTKDSWENEVSEAFASAFAEIGGSITAKEIVQTDVSDVKADITKLVVGKKPEAVFLGTYYQFINALKTLKDFQYKGKIYGIEVDSYLAVETKPRSDGIEFIAPDFYTSDFMEKFQNRYGEKPGIPAGQAYDAANILFSLIAKEKTADGIISEMRKVKSYNGVSGSIEFTQDNKTLFPTAIFVVKDGTVKKLEQGKTATTTKTSS